MGLTTSQDLKNREEDTAERKWTIKKLFPTLAVSSVISKTFLNVFDVLLGVSVVTVCLAELIHSEVSILMATVTAILAMASYRIKESELLITKEKENANT